MLDAMHKIAVLAIGRKTFHDPRIDRPDAEYQNEPKQVVNPGDPEANLVGSLTDDSPKSKDDWLHAPVLDLDYGAHLVPSSTAGNYHLFLEKEIKWKDYKKLLKLMGKIGLIEPGYADASIKRGSSFVRMPGVKKKRHWFEKNWNKPDDDICACGKPEGDRVHDMSNGQSKRPII